MPGYRSFRGGLFFVGFFGMWALVAFAFSPVLVIDEVPKEIRAGYAIGVLALLAGACWWSTRVSIRLELAHGQLRWRTLVRSGSIPVTHLVAVRPLFAARLVAVDRTGGPPVLLTAGKGFLRFVEDLSRANPRLRLGLVGYFRLAERAPGPSGYQPDP